MKINIFFKLSLMIAACLLVAFNCDAEERQEEKDRRTVEEQQSQYVKRQPIPKYDWSLERDLVRQLYDIRNQKVATHSVWRGDYSIVEGDCPSIGFGLPYDTSLSNPLKVAVAKYQTGVAVTEQAEPNGIFASKNTSATWVMCVGNGGLIEPVYVESRVTVYPGPVKVDYATNRVVRVGASSVRIRAEKR